MPIKIKILYLFAILLFCNTFVHAQTQTDTIVISTYYPSPYGSYNRLYVKDKLGIGIQTPNEKLDVVDTGVDSTIRLNRTDGATALWSAQSDGIKFGAYSNNILKFITANTERMRINELGQVAIGTTDNENRLFYLQDQRALTSTSDYNFYFGNLNESGVGIAFAGKKSGYATGRTAGYFRAWFYSNFDVDAKMQFRSSMTGGVPLLTMDSNSLVGILTDNPQYSLDVIGNIRATGTIYYGGSEGTANGTAYTKPDYVFKPGYKFITTEEVEKYLKTQGHLPWMTSVLQEKKENGDVINLTRMQFETVETVENLQLQVIALNKLINKQKENIERLVREIAYLEANLVDK